MYKLQLILNMEVRIENTQESDLNIVYYLFEQAIEYQKKKNYTVWKGYDRAALQKDVALKLQYKLISNEEILSIFSVCYADDIIWREKEQGNAIYLHRAVVNPKFRGNKMFAKIFDWAIQFGKNKGLSYIRMDTWADNPKIIDYYKSFGFEFVEYFKTPNSAVLPVQHRDLDLILLQYEI